MRSIMILGAGGNFGKRISRSLARSGCPLVICGRNTKKLQDLLDEHANVSINPACFDVNRNLAEALKQFSPCVLINTCGPFQSSDYKIAQTAIDHGVHYIDLADGRAFVNAITKLDEAAIKAGVSVISGASTVPGLSSAVLEHYQNRFSSIDELVFGISPGQKAERGLATTQGILSYVGRPLRPFKGASSGVYGWQQIYKQRYPSIGTRWMAACDIPDLDLLPERYAIGRIQFSAGLELGLLHLGLWGLSWMVRIGMPIDLPRFAEPMLKASNLFNAFGSADGGMHMIMKGTGHDGNRLILSWFIEAFEGYGPHIPTIPAIILARKLARGEAALPAGAMACVGLVGLHEYLEELSSYPIQSVTQTDSG